jgi:hypothetical protein
MQEPMTLLHVAFRGEQCVLHVGRGAEDIVTCAICWIRALDEGFIESLTI